MNQVAGTEVSASFYARSLKVQSVVKDSKVCTFQWDHRKMKKNMKIFVSSMTIQELITPGTYNQMVLKYNALSMTTVSLLLLNMYPNENPVKLY